MSIQSFRYLRSLKMHPSCAALAANLAVWRTCLAGASQSLLSRGDSDCVEILRGTHAPLLHAWEGAGHCVTATIFYFSLWNARDGTQDLMDAKPVLYHWAISIALYHSSCSFLWFVCLHFCLIFIFKAMNYNDHSAQSVFFHIYSFWCSFFHATSIFLLYWFPLD